MQCEECGEREAEVHVTQIVEGELTTVRLCDVCADDKGLSEGTGIGSGTPLADFLAEMGKSESEAVLPAVSESCPYCGTSAEDFRGTGRLGCSECWSHFEEQLRPLLRRIHGSTNHSGKLYISEVAEPVDDPSTRLNHLRQRLKRAVESEDFETAARLRDQIHEMEPVE